MFCAVQLRVFLRALVNLDPYTLTDDVAEHFVGANENNQQTAVEILLSAVDGLADDKLTGFALRLVLTGYVAMPRESEFDFPAEAATAFVPPLPKKATSTKRAHKASTKKNATAKKIPSIRKAA